jgi:hypothetical protein
MNNIQIYLDASQSVQDISIQARLNDVVLAECDISPGIEILTFDVDSIAAGYQFQLIKLHKNNIGITSIASV